MDQYPFPVRMQVTALLSGYTASNMQMPLPPISQGSNIYSAPLDLNQLFPSLSYTQGATLGFCKSNQITLRRACSAGIRNGLSFANSSVLLNACTQFLTNGALTSVSQAATQVALACAVVAVEVGLLCTSTVSSCDAVAEKTFTIR